MFAMLKEAFAGVSGVGALITMLLFIFAFVMIVVRVYRKSMRSHYDKMSRLPLEGRDSE